MVGRCISTYSPSCLEKLSEKGSERGFDRRFGQYTNAKTARKVSFRCPVRLRCRGVRYFSDSFSRDCPKSLEHTYSVALWVDKEGLFGPFHPPYISQIHEQSVARTLFGQSQKRNFRKLGFRFLEFSETRRARGHERGSGYLMSRPSFTYLR